MSYEDLTGQTFNLLTAISYSGYSATARSTSWLWQCACGKFKVIQATNVKSGHTRSCGCYQEKTRGLHSVTHGKTSSRVYHIWATMKARCHNKNHDKYKYYGALGIEVCEEWRDSFSAFIRDMGEPSEHEQIDRIDNSKGYQPDNCRWTTRTHNMRNKRNNHLVHYGGKDMPISQLCEEVNVPKHALYRRINEWKMSVEDAISSAQTRRRVNVKKTGKNSTI